MAVARPKSPFGVVDLGDGDVVDGFSEGGRIPYWVNCGIYVLSAEAIERFPDRGDHETTTFPELVAERAPARVPARGPVADSEHAEGAADRRRARRRPSGVARGMRGSPRWVTRSTRRTRTRSTRGPSNPAASRSRGARADLGAHRRLLRQGAVRQRRRVAVAPVPPREGRVVARRERAARRWSSAPSGRRRSRRRSSEPELPSVSRPGTVHRVTAIEDTTILEVSTPHLDDVVRLEDAYGREGTSEA